MFFVTVALSPCDSLWLLHCAGGGVFCLNNCTDRFHQDNTH